MPITAAVSRSYSIRMIALGVLCLVFGLWGLYDYYIGIPAQQAQHERFRMLDLVRTVFDQTPADEEYEQTLLDARQAVQAQVDSLVRTNLPDAADAPLTDKQVEQFVQAVQENEQQGLMSVLAVFQTALNQPRATSGVLTDVQVAANRLANDALAGMEPVTAPSGFDRAFQWIYILCLPFTPYFFWKWWTKKQQIYTLDDSGALHLPGGASWSDEDIVDIDMSRWMEKSIADVVHADGSRAELDDYYFHNMHLIVGHFAHKFHPDQWHEDARQRRDETDENDRDMPEADSPSPT